MVEVTQLEIAPAAYFFRARKRFTAAAITRLFKIIRDAARRPSHDLFRHVREAVDGSTFSAICFSHERRPAFLEPDAEIWDRVHGFLMLVERGGYVALFKSGLELPASFKSEYLARAERGRVESAVATTEAIFERIRVQSTSPSQQVLQAKTLEAANLENSMPMASASRYFTQAYSVRRPDGHLSATPSTGRISRRGDRGDHELAIAWAARVIDELSAGAGELAPFIRNFARRLDLDTLPPATRPIVFAANIPQLTDNLLGDQPIIRLVRQAAEQNGGGEGGGAAVIFEELQTADVETILSALDEALTVRPGRPDYRIKRGAGSVGTIRIGKTTISLRALDLPEIAGIEVERAEVPLGEDPDRRPVVRHLDREDLFTILFDDPSLAYVEGELFRDEALLDGGAGFLRHLQPFPSLAGATSEKGEFSPDQTEFSAESVFRKIVDDVSGGDDVLVCDDLGDEWADFIGLNTQSRPPSINFYHGKCGKVTLSASAFHDAVGQAEKNLGRLDLSPGSLPAKYNSWAPDYVSGTGVQTAIRRIVRGGDINQIASKIDEVRLAPDVAKRVYIVTSSLSKAQVADTFDNLANGARPSAHFVQLYWLLTAYFSACSEMGVVGFVACRP
jgi:hypothetical protein